jgi:hypothetical protein
VKRSISLSIEGAYYFDDNKGEAWMWEDNIGKNFNGFKFYATYFLGYQMPLLLNTVGILLEAKQNLGYVKDLSTMGSSGWGSDFVVITVGPVRFSFSSAGNVCTM